MPNKAFQITCPKCKEAFDAGDAFNAHFKNAQIESEKKLQEAQRQAVKDIENKYKSQIDKQVFLALFYSWHLYILFL